MTRLYRPGLVTRIGLVLLPALIFGSIANVVTPSRIPWVRNWGSYVSGQAQEHGIRLVTLRETRAIVSAGRHIIFDARAFTDYGLGHIPSALSLPEAEMETAFEDYRMVLTPEQPILVYCSGKECDESLRLGKMLMVEGFTNIVLFPGGFTEWQTSTQP